MVSEACAVTDTGWRPENERDVQFESGGRALVAQIRSLHLGDTLEASARGDLSEEMCAVLSGACELVCDDETYELSAGHGVIVPAGAARAWRALSKHADLYRVCVIAPQP